MSEHSRTTKSYEGHFLFQIFAANSLGHEIYEYPGGRP